MIKTTDTEVKTKTAEPDSLVCTVCGKLAKATIEKEPYCRQHFNELVITKPIVKTAALQNRNDACACGSGKKYKHCCSIKATNHKARHYFNSEYIRKQKPVTRNL